MDYATLRSNRIIQLLYVLRATCVILEVHIFIALVVHIYIFPLCQTYSPAFQSNTPTLNALNARN